MKSKKNDCEFRVENAAIMKAEIFSDESGALCVGVVVGTGSRKDPYVFRSECNADFIRKIMRIAGVKQWKDIIGRLIRVRGLDFSTIYFEIGHIIEDEWLSNFGGEK